MSTSLEIPSAALPHAVGTGEHRRFAVAWRNSTRRAIAPIGLLEHDGADYTFTYLASAAQLDGFGPLLAFPDLLRPYRSRRLFPFFAQRVMDRRRPDFPAYLKALGLSEEASDLDVLGRSGGQRKADKVQVVEEPLVTPTGTTAHAFVVHGVRHAPGDPDEVGRALAWLRQGDELSVVRETTNPVNPRALLIAAPGGPAVGWVPDLLVEYVSTVLGGPRSALRVLRVNGPDTPPHLRLVARLSGQAPLGYRPFGGPGWEAMPTTDLSPARSGHA